jgi:hypothetical protein
MRVWWGWRQDFFATRVTQSERGIGDGSTYTLKDVCIHSLYKIKTSYISKQREYVFWLHLHGFLGKELEDRRSDIYEFLGVTVFLRWCSNCTLITGVRQIGTTPVVGTASTQADSLSPVFLGGPSLRSRACELERACMPSVVGLGPQHRIIFLLHLRPPVAAALPP